MWQKAEEHKTRTRDSTLEKLYENYEFVTDKFSGLFFSSTKIAADGQIVRQSNGNIKDQHIQAELKLPTLQERCAMSKQKDLFMLSQQLAENEAENQRKDPAIVIRTPPNQTRLQKIRHKMPWFRILTVGKIYKLDKSTVPSNWVPKIQNWNELLTREDVVKQMPTKKTKQVHNLNTYFDKTAVQEMKSQKMQTEIDIMKKINAPQKKHTKTMQFGDMQYNPDTSAIQSYRAAQSKQQKAQIPVKDERLTEIVKKKKDPVKKRKLSKIKKTKKGKLVSTDETDDSDYKSAESSPRPYQRKVQEAPYEPVHHDAEQHTLPKPEKTTIWLTKIAPYVYVETAAEPQSLTLSETGTYWVIMKAPREYMEHAAEPQRLTRPETETDWQPMLRNILITVHSLIAEVFRVVKLIVHTYGNRYTYSLLLLLGTAAYLVYILFFDVNEYLNEEKRYLAKMKSSGILLKCYYYLMRLLKVPIT